jgi:hypothetical protein
MLLAALVGRAGESTVSKQEQGSKNPQYGSTSGGAVLLAGGYLAKPEYVLQPSAPMLSAMAVKRGPDVFAFVSKSLHLGFRFLECKSIDGSRFRHLRGGNRELDRELNQRFC